MILGVVEVFSVEGLNQGVIWIWIIPSGLPKSVIICIEFFISCFIIKISFDGWYQ